MEIVSVLPQLSVLRFPEVNDLNVYVWNDGAEVTLIDCGLPGTAGEIENGLKGLGFTADRVRRVILTHAHDDHIGSAADLAEWGAEIWVHHADADIVRGERPQPAPLLRDWERPIADALELGPAPRPAPVHRELRGGDVLDLGGGAEVLAVPGHTEGSLALYLPGRRVLFTGDTLANVGGVTMPGVFNLDSAAVEAAAHRLTELDVDVVCVGHGDVLTAEALQAWRSRRRSSSSTERHSSP
ncbi:MBL fold metallo-hydrolase [Nocardia asiatica]|uniref:MBL fold metallo-hydrolase n=1 Tax=Nocardia asiatica TaxID=209252 RepID=UPI002456CCF1|nr:MBL fold metallo-hydrolase [Nocardia asiatica]